MMEAKKGLYQRGVKRDTNYVFIFDIWIASKSFAEAVVDAGADMIGMVKTNTKIFCKYTNENLTKD